MFHYYHTTSIYHLSLQLLSYFEERIFFQNIQAEYEVYEEHTTVKKQILIISYLLIELFKRHAC